MKKIVLALLVLCWSFASCQDKTDSLPVLNSSVNDFEGIFEPEQEATLKESIEDFYKKTGIRITVVAVSAIEPYDNIFNFSLDLANKSNRGKILICVSHSLRQIQIQNHDEILETLTNEETKTILENFIIPKFKEGDYLNGVLNGITEIKKEF